MEGEGWKAAFNLSPFSPSSFAPYSPPAVNSCLPALLPSCLAIVSSEMRCQRIVHASAVLERREHDVGHHRGAAEDLLAHRVGDRVQHGAVAGADRRLADAAR